MCEESLIRGLTAARSSGYSCRVRSIPPRIWLAACVATACNRSIGTDDGAGSGNDAGSVTDASATSTAGETTTEGECPESAFPEPYCYKQYDISDALAGESFTVVGTGRFGPDGGPALLLAQPTSLHLGYWNAETDTLEISLAAQGPEGAQWDGGPYAEWLPAIVQGSSSTYDDVVLVHDGSFWHFPGAAGGLEAPIQSNASYEDDGIDWTVRAWKALAVMDLDGDGRSELVMEMGKAVQVWRQEPQGWIPWGPRYPDQFYPPVPGWSPDGWPVCPGTLAARAADLDGDGREDLVLLNESGCSTTDGYVERPVVVVLRNTNGTPHGLDPSYWHHGGVVSSVIFLDVGDLDGSGVLDIVVAVSGDPESWKPVRAHALRGRSDGTFEELVELLSDAYPLAVVDLDGDRVSELVAVPRDPEGAGVHALANTLQDPALVDLGVAPVSLLAVRDLNGDGTSELIPNRISSSGSAASYVIYLSQNQ